VKEHPSYSESKAGALQFDASPSQNMRPYFKYKLKKKVKGLSVWLKWWSACLTSRKLKVNPQYYQKSKTKPTKQKTNPFKKLY
jgi:hypothetical protein